MISAPKSSIEYPVRVLSDLHLGHPGCFIRSIDELRPLIEPARTVIFNGDSFEDRTPPFLEKARHQLKKLRELCQKCGTFPIFIKGNHDIDLPEHSYLDLWDGKIFVTHGDAIYPEVTPWSKNREKAVQALNQERANYSPDQLTQLEVQLDIAKAVSRALGVRQPKAKAGAFGKVLTIINESWPPHRPLLILKTWANAGSVAHDFFFQHRPDATFFVLGHTHRATVCKKLDRYVVNTGAFVTISKPWMVEIEENVLRVLSLEKKHTSFRPTRQVREWRRT